MGLPLCITDLSHAQLAGFPPSLLLCGEADALLQSSAKAAMHLKAAGCECSNVVVPGGFHGWLGIPACVEFVACKLSIISTHSKVLDFLCRDHANPTRPVPNSRRYVIGWSIVMFIDLITTSLVIFPSYVVLFVMFRLPFTREFWTKLLFARGSYHLL